MALMEPTDGLTDGLAGGSGNLVDFMIRNNTDNPRPLLRNILTFLKVEILS
jgi:hypothetical protein